jgi:uncharacterized protein (DUF1684 family)
LKQTALIGVTAFLCLFLLHCKSEPDINASAHSIHVDSFMAKRLEKEIMEQRQKKDDYFKTSPDSPLPTEVRAVFTGLEYYPINWKYRFEGPVIRYPDPEKFMIITTSGEKREALKYGYIRFLLDGKDFKLEVYRLLDVEEKDLLFVPFIDANVGKETYDAGRYIDLVEKPNGVYVIDFNNAYNPSCSYGGNFPCPVTPKENRLPIPIPAGEKILPIAPRKAAG